MAKSHKIILLALIALILLVSNTLVEAQGLSPDPPPNSPGKKTPDPSPTDPIFPPPPPITTPKKSPPTPPPPPKTTPDPPPTPKTPDPPPKTPDPPPKSDPVIPSTPPPVISTPTPVLPAPTFAPVVTPSTPSQSPPTNTAPFSTPTAGQPISCSAPNDCNSYGMFCNLSLLICQPKGTIGDKCVNSNECSNDFICNRSICQYRDNGTNVNKKIESNNIKKAAITGAIIVGVFIISGIIFFANSCYKRRERRNGNVITSSTYSTDDGTDPIYPFIERSNSFSNKNNNNKNNNNNNNIPTSHAPTTNQYDPLPPTGNGGFMGPRQGYYNNYYNDEYSGAGYMRQNDNQLRTRNILQQTRGNVMIAPQLPHVAPPPPPPPHLPPHVPPPHLQQNYNWNYGVVPGVPPAKKPLMMNQGQELLFPVPPVERNYGHNPLPNNTNIEDKKSGTSHNSPQEDTGNVNLDNKQKKTQNLKDLPNLNPSNTSTSKSNVSNSTYNVESIDTYAREPMKTSEVKLSQSTNNLTINTPTIESRISKDSIRTKKQISTRSRSQTFGGSKLGLSKSSIKISDESTKT